MDMGIHCKSVVIWGLNNNLARLCHDEIRKKSTNAI
jgi:hypothetical protein